MFRVTYHIQISVLSPYVMHLFSETDQHHLALSLAQYHAWARLRPHSRTSQIHPCSRSCVRASPLQFGSSSKTLTCLVCRCSPQRPPGLDCPSSSCSLLVLVLQSCHALCSPGWLSSTTSPYSKSPHPLVSNAVSRCPSRGTGIGAWAHLRSRSCTSGIHPRSPVSCSCLSTGPLHPEGCEDRAK